MKKIILFALLLFLFGNSSARAQDQKDLWDEFKDSYDSMNFFYYHDREAQFNEIQQRIEQGEIRKIDYARRQYSRSSPRGITSHTSTETGTLGYDQFLASAQNSGGNQWLGHASECKWIKSDKIYMCVIRDVTDHNGVVPLSTTIKYVRFTPCNEDTVD
ncbi:MAG: hypothetical protein R3A45_06180 [Bdellovibrionota bacterium]